MALRVLVCGGRKFDDWRAVSSALNGIHERDGIACIIQGGAGGADYLAKKWARCNGIPGIEIEAQWMRYGKKAGPIRNGWMLDLAKPDLVIAFPGFNGTADMTMRAQNAGIKLLIPLEMQGA